MTLPKRKIPPSLGALLVATVSCALLANPDMQPPIDLPSDELLRCAQLGCLGLLLSSLLMVAWGTLRAARGTLDLRSKKIFLCGFLLFPTPAFLFMGWKVEKQTKTVSFCQSCHTAMDPFVDDMLDPKSKSLASLHFNNRYIQQEQCYTCHAGVGTVGAFQAKRNGLIHLYKYATDTWQAPIALYEPFDWNTCLQCHRTSQLFLAPREDPGAHDGILEEMETGDSTCVDCHKLAHPKPEDRSSR